jgi:hypothetical protein
MPYCSRCTQTVEDIRSHRCATNKATNSATNRPAAKSNPVVAEAAVVAKEVLRGELAARSPEVWVGRTANRRSREAYNAYQREYMRKRRAGRN